MAWEEWCTEDERLAHEEAQRLFSDQRACKEAEKEELRQRALYNEAEIKLMAEEVRAEQAAREAEALAAKLAAKQEVLQLKAKEQSASSPAKAGSSPTKKGAMMRYVPFSSRS